MLYFSHNYFNYPRDYLSEEYGTDRSKISTESGAIHQQHEQKDFGNTASNICALLYTFSL